MAQVLDLGTEECMTLLRAGVTGRVAVVAPDGPHVLPINYSVVEDAVVVRTSPYSLLGTHGTDARLAFEVDQFDYENQRGWSVLVRGRSAVVQDLAEIDRINAGWGPRPWAAGGRPLMIRIPCTEVSGRRLGGGWDLLQQLPVRRVT